jgi:hypothetical protein
MIIHQPEMFKRDGNTIIYAKIEMNQPRDHFPEYLWYRVPEHFTHNLSMQSDAFLIPGLIGGMHFKEDIEVRGSVSPKLAYNLDEYQYLLNFRMAKDVTPVEIKYTHLKALQASPSGVGTTFSGGVDSLFTIWKHLPQNQPIKDYQISHALFIHGFDILIKEKQRYQTLFSNYRNALKEINIELISLETNLISLIIPRMITPHFYGPVLIGAAHVFGNLFKKFFIPSSSDYKKLLEWTSSSDPITDPLLSSDVLEIIHNGAASPRGEKIEAICDWKIAQDHLRVCMPDHPEKFSQNCSRCEKCVRTMIPLYALGKLDKFKTFEKPFTSNYESLWWIRKFNPKRGFVKETFSFARKVKPDLVPWLRIAALAGHVRYRFVNMIPKPVQSWLKQFGYFDNPDKKKHAFDDPLLIEFIKSKGH